jgi:hypothetical protein
LITIGFIIVSLGCGPGLPLFANEEAQLQATRTPLPTFTATTETIFEFPATATPPSPPPEPATASAETVVEAPPARPTPPPVESAAAEPTPEANPAEPVAGQPAPAEPAAPPTEVPLAPTQVPPEAPPAEPAPAAEPGPGSHGVIGEIIFREGRNTYGVGEKVFVRIKATSTQGGQLPFGILGLTTSTGAFQTSWSSGSIDGSFNHEDGVPFSQPGQHKMWLSICFSTEAVCQGPDGDWERFEPGLDVIIQ